MPPRKSTPQSLSPVAPNSGPPAPAAVMLPQSPLPWVIFWPMARRER